MFGRIPMQHRWTLGIALAAGLSSMLLRLTPWGQSLEDYLARRAEFAIRSALAQGPVLSPRLKIFNFDDAAVGLMQSTELGLEDWALVFEALARSQPNHIFIDKVFAMPKGLAQAEDFTRRMRQLGTPLVVGGFSTTTALPGRPPLALDQPWNHLGRFDAAAGTERFGYGPHASIAAAFSYIGHLSYAGAGRVVPLLRMNAESVLPHVGLAAAHTMDDAWGGLQIDGVEVPLHDGQIQVNLPTPRDFMGRAYSMAALIQHARDRRPISVVAPGDEVVLLPSMFTGDTDWVMTPAGQIPGSYVVVGVINSVMTQTWLRDASGGSLIVLAGGLLGFGLNLATGGVLFWLGVGAATSALVGGGLLGFSYFGVMLPWLYTSLAFLLSSLGIFAYMAEAARFARAQMQRELATAGLVQKAFFPKPTAASDGLTVLGHLQPTAECGGDWWWQVRIAPGVVMVLIGDVMGHGIPAALITAMMYAALSDMDELHLVPGSEHPSPSQLLDKLNKMLFLAFDGKVTMTMFVGRFDTHAGILTYANAGHCFPIFFPSPQRTAPVSVAGRSNLATSHGVAYTGLLSPSSVLGMEAKGDFREMSLTLHRQDRFVFYTDGVVENRGWEPRPWGRRNLVALLVELAAEPPGQVVAALTAQINQRSHGTKQEDDCTVVIVDITADLDDSVKPSNGPEAAT